MTGWKIQDERRCTVFPIEHGGFYDVMFSGKLPSIVGLLDLDDDLKSIDVTRERPGPRLVI